MLIPGLIPITAAIIAKDSEPVNPVRDLQDRHTRDLPCQTVVAFIVAATCRSSVYSSRSPVPFREKRNAATVHPRTINRLVTTTRNVLESDLKILINSRTRFRWTNFRGKSTATTAVTTSERAGRCALSILAYQTSCFCFRGDNSPTRCLGLARLKSPLGKFINATCASLPVFRWNIPELERISVKAMVFPSIIHVLMFRTYKMCQKWRIWNWPH